MQLEPDSLWQLGLPSLWWCRGLLSLALSLALLLALSLSLCSG